MGLTKSSVGSRAADVFRLSERDPNETVIALCGNPNVGKSTVFNALTGMHQHTGNWPGKTVTNAQGVCRFEGKAYRFVDIPGTYSLLAHSAEEEVARDFICFGEPDAVVVVCDATALERNLNLVLQVLEAHPRVTVCVNLLDEAKRKHIHIDLPLLQKRLGVPVVGVIARKRKSLNTLLRSLSNDPPKSMLRAKIPYPDIVERALAFPQHVLEKRDIGTLEPRWLALKLLEEDSSLTAAIDGYLGAHFLQDPELRSALSQARNCLKAEGVDAEGLKDLIASAPVEYASHLMQGVSRSETSKHASLDRKLDRILTGRVTAYPVMLLLLALIFWLTISLSNIPSQWLASLFDRLLALLRDALISISAPPWLRGVLIDGILQVLCRVVSVMLPPMAIFFPLFTLLEDAGYLPRVAYNLDRPFARCHACGKQALTMCMGFGCNAAGVVGCRIIDSPRERLLAILTNSFVPCNGRFPALIALLSIFFVGSAGGALASLGAALGLCALILCGILATLLVTRLLSRTILRGVPSSFVLEMPPYRVPEVGKVLVRSIFDRTLFVLARSVAVAAPAGLLIWGLANIFVGDVSLLTHCTQFLDPAARLIGLDGVILTAFILGLPANEIVIPIMTMAYLSTGTLTELNSLSEMHTLLTANGWTVTTALCTMVFFLLHWPCATTLLTIKKETGSLRYTILAAALPIALGALICFLIAWIGKIF